MFLFGDWFIRVWTIWGRLIRQPLKLVFRTFDDPNAPRPPTQDDLDRARGLDAADSRREVDR